MHYLYKIIDTINNKVYIGQTINEVRRWQAHKSYAKNPVLTGQYIHRAMAKYGVENFIYEVIATCKTQEDADETETLLIKQYDSYNVEKGYNISPVGGHAWNTGLPSEQQPMYGKHHSIESKTKISKNNKGLKKRHHTEEEKLKISKFLTNRPVSIETRQKISNSQKGKSRWSNEQKEKISKRQIGKSISEEQKSKISSSLRGKYTGENSASSKLNWKLVDQIREKYNNEKISTRILSKEYGVCVATIFKIINNLTWRKI